MERAKRQNKCYDGCSEHWCHNKLVPTDPVLVVGGSDIENTRDKYRTRPDFAVLIVPNTVITLSEFDDATNQSVKVLR